RHGPRRGRARPRRAGRRDRVAARAPRAARLPPRGGGARLVRPTRDEGAAARAPALSARARHPEQAGHEPQSGGERERPPGHDAGPALAARSRATEEARAELGPARSGLAPAGGGRGRGAVPRPPDRAEPPWLRVGPKRGRLAALARLDDDARAAV